MANLIWVFLLILWIVILSYLAWQYLLKPRFGRTQRTSSRRHRRKGKRCPQCRNLIDARRTICQHCGYVFAAAPANPSSEPNSSPDSDSKRKRGKRCPQCRTMIDYHRPVCQHCGFTFYEARAAASPADSSPPFGLSGDGI